MEDTTLTSKLMVDLLSENVPLITEETEFKSSIGISPSKIPDPITYADKIEWTKINYKLEKDSIKAVSGKLGMSTNNIVHNKSKQQVDTIPQCTASRFYSCGWCGFGCKYDEKQSAMITWLLDAKNQGAKRLEDCA
ncbi:1896_t:CDS:2 [Entrophospora sp. SA101]|nr:6488_t:CDS:2 [Entrophospora sp. SA101]CAJ0753644.1 24113_t:CDS:2 [Entrophospora sp. SA101]CAJ0765310.1 1896_t:CDS:2 [Entrophospora sp. SA101]